MSDLIISVSGLRGVIGESLTPSVAVAYVGAFVADLPDGPIVVSRDGRPSGAMLAQAVHAAVIASGRDVLDAGVAATPTLGVLVKSVRAAGGVQISASHNPSPYNGLKLFNDAGRVIPGAAGEAVRERYRAGAAAWVPHDQLGRRVEVEDPHAAHLEAVLRTVDADRIRAAGFKVLLDSNHGAGGALGRRLLEALGCQVVCVGEQPTGHFAHPPEPTAANLRDVGDEIRAAHAAVGFCQDPDADRLALIDEAGRYVGEEYTVALCIDHALARRAGPVVVNCATSRMNQDIAKSRGVELHQSAVGEANVVDRMLQEQAVFGGEGNGGPIDPEVVLVRDSFVGMARVLDLMAERQTTLSAAVDALPRYDIEKTTAAVDRSAIPQALDALESRMEAPRASRQDGLRLDWDDRWLLVRASNTEPIVRLIAEAETADAARSLCDQAAAVIASL